MDVKLIVVGGKNSGQAIPVSGPKFFIGRGEDCQLRPRSDRVSRQHCAIVQEEGLVLVRDFGSKNGTFVNGEPVKAERELKAGDRLKVGPLEFDVQLEVNLSGKKKPKVRSVEEAAARTVESAGAKAKDEDADISSWLADDDETVSGRAGRDTTWVPTNQPKPATAEKSTSDNAPSEPTQDRPDPLAGWQEPKPTAASSRAAANDMLKQFFQRKP